MTAPAAELGQPELTIPKADPDDLTLWSVTTLLKVIASEGLIYWAAGETATAAIDDAADRIRESGVDEHFMLQFLLGRLGHSEEFRMAVDQVIRTFGPALAPLPPVQP